MRAPYGAKTDLLPAPNLIGLPKKFDRWRRNQPEAVLRAMDSDKRFVVLGMPTGFGKSIVYLTCGVLGEPTVFLTSTKGLQSQLVSDFGDIGLVDIRGMGNYECKELSDGDGLFGKADKRPPSCEQGPCLAGWECGYASGGCSYFDAQRLARNSHLTTTNYAYWMAVHARGLDPLKPPLGFRGCLVLDEAHAAVDELGNHLSIELGFWEVEGVLGEGFPDKDTMEEWKRWGRTLNQKSEAMLEDVKGRLKRSTGKERYALSSRMRELSSLSRRLGQIATMKSEWVHEESRDRRGRRVVKFDPVWPGEYAEATLFLKCSKVILTSATIRPKTLELLGIKSDEYEFLEYNSSFPIKNRPFIYVPTVQVRFGMDNGSMRVWAAKIDRIISMRNRVKGIVHTVSFDKRDYLLRHSEHGNRIITHESGGLADAVRRFRDLPPESGAVLVSPSVSTGFDFPGDECRYQVIAKVPFPSTQSKVLKARGQRDPDFFAYVTAQQIVQMAGRGVRSETDWCETLIVDDQFKWFRWKYKQFFPKWFLASCTESSTVPEPLAY